MNLRLLKKLKIRWLRWIVGLLTLREPKEVEGSMESWWSNIGNHYVVWPQDFRSKRNKAWEEKKFGEVIVLLKKTYGFTRCWSVMKRSRGE